MILRRRGRIARFVPVARRACAAALLSGLLPFAGVSAQAANYPSMQVPTASVRDYTGAIASGGGTAAVFQWREGMGTGMHLGLDVGLSDRRGSENLMAFFGGSIGSELLRAQGDQPLDMLLTGGAGLAFGGSTTILRVPVGVSLGHTFELEEGMALTPYVHPRVSLDLCSNCGRRGNSRTELSLNFDIGVSWRVNRQFAVRAAAVFSGAEYFGGGDAFGIGITWTPPALQR